jgi:hypothetical protein
MMNGGVRSDTGLAERYHVPPPFFIDTFVSLAIPSLQLRLTTSLFSNLDSKLKTNTQYLSIVQCRVLVLICSHIFWLKFTQMCAVTESRTEALLWTRTRVSCNFAVIFTYFHYFLFRIPRLFL